MNKLKSDDIIALLNAAETAKLTVSVNQDMVDPNWKDATGKTLLHFAAAIGDTSLAQALIAKGASALNENSRDELAIDTAAAWGHAGVAEIIKQRMVAENTAAAFPFASLDEIRAETKRTGTDQFHRLARLCAFDRVIELAEKDPQRLLASDLTGKGTDDESTILKLARRGDLAKLLRSKNYKNGLTVLGDAFAGIPEIFLKQADVSAFMAELRRDRLKTLARHKL